MVSDWLSSFYYSKNRSESSLIPTISLEPTCYPYSLWCERLLFILIRAVFICRYGCNLIIVLSANGSKACSKYRLVNLNEDDLKSVLIIS